MAAVTRTLVHLAHECVELEGSKALLVATSIEWSAADRKSAHASDRTLASSASDRPVAMTRLRTPTKCTRVRGTVNTGKQRRRDCVRNEKSIPAVQCEVLVGEARTGVVTQQCAYFASCHSADRPSVLCKLARGLHGAKTK